MSERPVMHVPLTDMEMLGILYAILKSAWEDGKHFCISVICGATGRVMSFPMKGTMLVSCDRPEARGVATKKATVLYLTGAATSREIGVEWLTKPYDEDLDAQPHRELAYLADPAHITGYEGAHRRDFDVAVALLDSETGRPTGMSATARKTVIIACSGDEGAVDATYAQIGFAGFEAVWSEPASVLVFRE